MRAAQKVRLLHATIRPLTLRTRDWDLKAWGIPINQKDLTGTLMTFSYVILDAFDALRIEYTAKEGEACGRPSSAKAGSAATTSSAPPIRRSTPPASSTRSRRASSTAAHRP